MACDLSLSVSGGRRNTEKNYINMHVIQKQPAGVYRPAVFSQNLWKML